eukprot:scaffold7245_cov197-Ochromonas_danica.AAC.2
MDWKHSLYVYALGFCVMNGKQAAIWQSGGPPPLPFRFLYYGVWNFFTATAVCAFFYLCLTYCLAELVSIVPFSGGCYGYVRCTLGPTIGFLTGCSEAAKYTLFNLMTVYTVGVLFQNIYDFQDDWLPVIWLACYVLAIALKVVPLRWSVYVWVGLAAMTLVTQCIFIFGSVKVSNWKHFRKDINAFDSKRDDFLQALSSAGYFFFGIDSVRTCMDDESNKVVPKVMVVVTFISIFTALASIISMRAYSMNPLLFATNFFPYMPGLEKALPQANEKLLNLLDLPCIVGATLGFFYSGGKQVSSMMESGLLPSLSLCGIKKHNKVGDAAVMQGGIIAESGSGSVEETMTVEKVNRVSQRKDVLETIIPLSCCGIVSYVLLVVCYYKVNGFLSHVIRTAISLASIEGFCMMGAYVIFSTRFGNMERGLKSPFGAGGAVLAMVYWGYLFVANLYFQDEKDRLWEGLSVLFFFVVCLTYYIVFASRWQFFSKEEQEKFLKAYVVNVSMRGSMVERADNATMIILCAAPSPLFSCNQKRGVCGGNSRYCHDDRVHDLVTFVFFVATRKDNIVDALWHGM